MNTKRILQVVAKTMISETCWVDIMDIPDHINDLKSFYEVAQKDFNDRAIRIIEVLEDHR